MNVAIIAAAGKGTRMAGARPKQFLELAGTPIIFHTLKPFEQCDRIQQIIAVLPAEEAAQFTALARQAGLHKLVQVVVGGETRAESVSRGLEAIKANRVEIVAIHDGVRPFVTPEEISSTVEAAKITGAAILVAPLTDTIKEIQGKDVVRTLSRTNLRSALTPQCFRYDLLQKAYQGANLKDPGITDDSILVERTGASVTAVEGSSQNIKITTPQDLAMAKILLQA